MVSLAVMPDHVHMLVKLPPNVSVSQAVKNFKGGSSQAICQAHPELQEWLWGDSFWADVYFAENCRITENAVKMYLENQEDKTNRPKQKSLGL